MSGVTNPGCRCRLCTCLALWACSNCAMSLPSSQPTPAEIFPKPFAQHAPPVERRPDPRLEEAVTNAVPGSETFVAIEAEPQPTAAAPRKKRKKLSPINRLRQLYFLPLLHPLGGKH